MCWSALILGQPCPTEVCATTGSCLFLGAAAEFASHKARSYFQPGFGRGAKANGSPCTASCGGTSLEVPPEKVVTGGSRACLTSGCPRYDQDSSDIGSLSSHKGEKHPVSHPTTFGPQPFEHQGLQLLIRSWAGICGQRIQACFEW